MAADTREWFVAGPIEIREGRGHEPTMLGGYAAVFNQETLMTAGDVRWRERIAPTAFDGVLERADVIAAVNHSASMVLGRAKAGTLKLTVDRNGLRYDVKLPNTSLGRDTVENIRNGNYPGSSFKFEASRDGLRLEPPRRSDDLPLIVIERVDDLIDVGPVTFPAYGGTTVSVRGGVEDFLRAHDACVKTIRDSAMRDRIRARLAIERARL